MSMDKTTYGRNFVIAPGGRFKPAEADNRNADARRKAEARRGQLDLEQSLKESWDD